MTRAILILSILGWSCLRAEDQVRVLSGETTIRIEQRCAVMQDFRARLDAAQTAEERHAVAVEMGTELMAMPPLAIDGKSARENLAEAKAKVGSNPELLAKLTKQEEWLTKIGQINAKLQEAASVEGPQKQELLEEAHMLRQTLGQSMKEERDAAMMRKQSQAAPPAELATRIEKQRQDAEELRQALQEANTGERTQVFEAWRAKQQTEMANQQ